MPTRAAILVLVLLTAVRPAAAASATAEKEARRNFQAGEAHFKAGLYAEALADYQAGYAAHPLPGFLINVAQCQRRLGELAKSRATYEKFLLVAPDSPLVPEVKRLIADLDQMLAHEAEAQETPKPAKISTDEAEPVAPVLELSPPDPTTEPAGATAATLTVTAEPAQPAHRSVWKRWWVWGLIGAAVAGGTVAAFALSSPSATTIHDGTLGTLRR
jgi:tetratricopeptide (TPR) repeat protein